jgi:hypothetical protein
MTESIFVVGLMVFAGAVLVLVLSYIEATKGKP